MQEKKMEGRWVNSGIVSNWLEQLEQRQLLSGDGHGAELKVMSQNLYFGADLGGAIAVLANPASSLTDILGADSAVWRNVVNTNFTERAHQIAREVKANHPDVIGLQEAALWQTGPLGGPATSVQYDFVQIMLDQLAAEGLHYKSVAVTNNFTAEAPAFIAPGTLGDIKLTDRDALLVRTDGPANAMKISNVQGHTFSTILTIPLAAGALPITRSYIQADIKLHGQTVRLVTTHLEASYPPIRDAQAQELLAGPGNTNLPTIVIGDFNSDGSESAATLPTDNASAYLAMLGAGFSDAWTQTHHHNPGLTWGQAADLTNATSTATERIDLVLMRNGASAENMKIVGDSVADKTASGSWPSDHAGVVATIEIGDERHGDSAGEEFRGISLFRSKAIKEKARELVGLFD